MKEKKRAFKALRKLKPYEIYGKLSIHAEKSVDMQWLPETLTRVIIINSLYNKILIFSIIIHGHVSH